MKNQTINKLALASISVLPLALLIMAALILLTGCETTSFERGVIAGESAKAIFDTPEDEAKFREIKADIVARLANPEPITAQIVSAYVARIKTGFSPAMWQIVQRRLDTELPDVEVPVLGELDDSRIREFLTGVAASFEGI